MTHSTDGICDKYANSALTTTEFLISCSALLKKFGFNEILRFLITDRFNFRPCVARFSIPLFQRFLTMKCCYITHTNKIFSVEIFHLLHYVRQEFLQAAHWLPLWFATQQVNSLPPTIRMTYCATKAPSHPLPHALGSIETICGSRSIKRLYTAGCRQWKHLKTWIAPPSIRSID